MNQTVLGIIGLVIFVAVGMLLQHIFGKARNKIDKKLHADKYAAEEDLFSTTVYFDSSASIGAVREALRRHVTMHPDKFIKKGMHVIHDSEKGVAWQFGSPDNSDGGFIANLHFEENGGRTKGTYCIANHRSTANKVSPFINEMTQLRNEVIGAYRAVDHAVAISTGKQTMQTSETMSWL